MNIQQCTVDRRKDAYEVLIPNTSPHGRGYMLPDLALDQKNDALSTTNNPDSSAVIVVKIQNMVKQSKSDQCTLDFVIGFIKSTVVESS